MVVGLVLVIDNYDSFVYNLVQYLGELGSDPLVYRHDEATLEQLVDLEPAAVLVSPGPGRPEDAGVSNAAIDEFGRRGVPVLGVCLGHQCIGQLYGGRVVRAGHVMHGKTSMIRHSGDGLFADLPNPFRPPGTTRWWWSATPSPTAWRSPPRRRTASSWASATATCRSRACSSIPSRS